MTQNVPMTVDKIDELEVIMISVSEAAGVLNVQFAFITHEDDIDQLIVLIGQLHPLQPRIAQVLELVETLFNTLSVGIIRS